MFSTEVCEQPMLYRTNQYMHKPAEYLSIVKCASNRRLTSRFRTGCHGLRVTKAAGQMMFT